MSFFILDLLECQWPAAFPRDLEIIASSGALQINRRALAFSFVKFKLMLILCLFSKLLLASNANIGDKIQQNFDDNLFKLRPITQAHYAVRLYRITGEKKYLYPIITSQFIESVLLEHLLQQITYSSIEKFNPKTIDLPENYEFISKTKKRNILLAHFPRIKKALSILLILDHAQQLNTLNSPLYPHMKIAIRHIKKNIESLSSFLLDITVIKTSSAQVANFVYLLKRLQLIDLQKEYIQQFRIVFSDKKDNSLNDQMFEDKIYGMTHIIFAASDYYQKKLPYDEFKWIYQYFEQNIDKILLKTKPDVIAEVGLTFSLINNNLHRSLLNKIKNHLTKEFNPAKKMITGKRGFDNFNRAEHRNVLTIMLFKWPQLLHPGPNLEANENLLKTLQTIQPL